MAHLVSSYSFSVEGSYRTFHHRWHIGDSDTRDCDTCRSTRPVSDSYRTHWPATKSPALSKQHKELLQKIDAGKIQKFVLCKRRTSSPLPALKLEEFHSKHWFLVEAAESAIPEFLSLMFQSADALTLQLGLYICVSDMKTRLNNQQPRELLVRSSALKLHTHYDILQSCDMLFAMLLEHTERHLCSRDSDACPGVDSYEVKRIELQVRRLQWTTHCGEESREVLPLQYSVKQACVRRNASTASFAEEARSIYPVAANFYGFQRCATSGELLVVPYALQPPTAEGAEVPNFVITTDINGDERDLVPIRNLRKFLSSHTVEAVLTCPRCEARFIGQAQLTLHLRLQCGRGFEVVQLPPDRVELYENCVPLQCEALRWPFFGIGEQKKE